MNNINKVLAQRIEQYAQRYGMLDCTDLVVGYSGGADSSLLLYVLSYISQGRAIRLYAAHVNHMLRGDAADADEEFCRRTCARLGVEFCSLRADVRALSRERAQSEETCARDVRYGFFEQIKGEIERCVQGARVHIATAHNSTDNAETVLFNLTRGSAISGVTGIPPIRDSYIVRPILCLSKDEVLDYADDDSLVSNGVFCSRLLGFVISGAGLSFRHNNLFVNGGANILNVIQIIDIIGISIKF